MMTNKFGEIVLSADDLCNAIMRGQDICQFSRALTDHTVDLDAATDILEPLPHFVRYNTASEELTQLEFDRHNQNHWLMPDEYKQLDIAKYVLTLCKTEAQLQRVGEELLLFQERNLFDLLRYLKYLVDVMRDNNVIWGVGRGSSVASYVLYLLGVHRVDSMFYDLDPNEFLR